MSEWRHSTWGEEVTLEYGKALRDYSERGDFPVFGTNGPIGWTDKPLAEGPGVILGRKGAYRGVHYSPEPFFVIDTAYYVVPKTDLEMRWLYYAISYHQLGQIDDGSPIPSTTRAAVYPREIVVPSPDEQRTIAGVLASLDDKIEQNRQKARVVERLSRAIFRAWFVDFEPVKAKAEGATSFPSMPQEVFDALPTRFVDSEIGPVPEGWEVAALSSVSTLVSGGTPKRSEETYWGGDVPWYSVKDAPGDGEMWVINTSERITEDGLANSAARVVPKGCTIISARGTVGRLGMAGIPMAFNQSCYGLLPKEGQSFGYLNLLMQAVVADLQRRTHGSVFDTITRSTFDGLLVANPRSDFVSAFERAVHPLFEFLLASLYESRTLAKMRDYLLPKLLSGQVRVEAAGG